MDRSITKIESDLDALGRCGLEPSRVMRAAILRWRERWLLHLAVLFVVFVIAGVHALTGVPLLHLLSAPAHWPVGSLGQWALGSTIGIAVGVLLGRDCIRWAKTRVRNNLFYPERLGDRLGRNDLPSCVTPILMILFLLDTKLSVGAIHMFAYVVPAFMIGTLMFWLMIYERQHGPVYIVDPNPPPCLG